MNTSDILNTAADQIQYRGWTRIATNGGWHPEPGSTNPVCLEGGIRAAVQETNLNTFAAATAHRRSREAMADFLTDTHPEAINSVTGRVIPFAWNDATGRTVDEVIAVLRAAAVVEATKEHADARELVSA